MFGLGPARPAGLGKGTVVEYFAPGPGVDPSWGIAKVLWAIDPAVSGPVLIRGRQLNGPGEVAFEDPPVPELVLNLDSYPGRPGSWKDNPSYTRVRSPGCYAYQIDTAEGTWTVIFIARPR